MITLVQLNIEQRRHIGEVTNFLKSTAPEVACIQELRESDVGVLEEAMGAKCVFAPMVYRESQLEGVGIFTTLPIVTSGYEYYAGDGLIRAYDNTTADTKVESQSYPILWMDVQKDTAVHRFVTTHFPWTPDGTSSDYQREHVASMLQILKSIEGFVLTGDFNAPRGGEIFAQIAARYVDNVPVEYSTSIDPNLHRAGDLKLMVDGVFSTPEYHVSDVVMHCGISDHCAFVANVTTLS